MTMDTMQGREEHGSEAEHWVAAARDALSDDMIGRLSGFCSDGLEIVDQLNRSGISRTLPLLVEMVDNGDLDRLSQLARVYQAAQDALTDEMVGRLAETLSESLSLLDRFNRGGGARLIEWLGQLESSGALEKISTTLPRLLDKLEMLTNMLTCLETASKQSHEGAASGGFGNLWQLMTRRETQQSLQFLVTLSQQMQAQCAKE